MVNGTPIALEGQEGEAIKECLLKGAIPNQDLINHLLYKVLSIFLCRVLLIFSKKPFFHECGEHM